MPCLPLRVRSARIAASPRCASLPSLTAAATTCSSSLAACCYCPAPPSAPPMTLTASLSPTARHAASAPAPMQPCRGQPRIAAQRTALPPSTAAPPPLPHHGLAPRPPLRQLGRSRTAPCRAFAYSCRPANAAATAIAARAGSRPRRLLLSPPRPRRRHSPPTAWVEPQATARGTLCPSPVCIRAHAGGGQGL